MADAESPVAEYGVCLSAFPVVLFALSSDEDSYFFMLLSAYQAGALAWTVCIK